MEEKEMWINKLKEKLEDYSEPAPSSGWSQLEKELMPPVEKKIYPYRKWMTAAAAVIVLAVVSSVTLYFLGTPTADEAVHSSVPALATVPDAMPEVSLPNDRSISVEQATQRMQRRNRVAQVVHSTNEEVEIPKEQNQEDVSSLIPVEEVVDAQTQTQTQSEQVTPEKVTPERSKPHRPSSKDKLQIPTQQRVSGQKKWSTGLFVGNSGGATPDANSASLAYMSRVDMPTMSNGMMNIPSNQELFFADGVPYLRQTKQVVDIKHHQPISFGLSVRKDLAKGFSLETGLTYTLLSSDATLAGEEREIEQKLHYIGIPLRANWNFLDKKRVTLYVSGGGMVEKCVYGKLGSEKETVKPLQFSVSGGVGAQVNATKRVGIYIEPGVVYHFDDGSKVQTIRKEHQFNFNIQAGVRLTY